ECQLTLGQTAIYMAQAPKSNSSALAIWAAMKDAREGRTVPVPKHLRDGHYAGAKRLANGVGYQYPHDHEHGYVQQDYLGVDKTYYTPKPIGYEVKIQQRLAALAESIQESAQESAAQSDEAPQPENADGK
ncbi:MAG TPA: hypothetical protein VGB55_06810, partial [Tepidisphaeraceae bacterium]